MSVGPVDFLSGGGDKPVLPLNRPSQRLARGGVLCRDRTLTAAQMPSVLSTLVGAPDATLDRVNRFTGATAGLGSFILFFTFLTQAASNSPLAAAAPDAVKRMGALLAVLSDTGYVLRLTGSLGVLAGLKRLEASDEKDATLLNLKRVQLLANLVYYLSENVSFLGGKGVLNLDSVGPARSAAGFRNLV